jgi:mono/diheme cytochrome c family protein
MKRLLKWAAYGLGGVVAVAVLAAGGAFAASEIMIRAPQERPATHLVATVGSDAVARGHRVATEQGCLDCHGANLQGRMFDDLPGVVRLYAPNLTLAVAKQSDADLDRAIRHAVGADGRPLWVMPSSTFAHLTDAETADLIAYLRSVGPQGPPQPRFQVRPIGRLGVLLGKFRSERSIIKAHENPALPDFGAQYAQGRALARACVECHGAALKGGAGVLKTPDLMIAASYDPADFERFLHTGKAAGDRELKVMSGVARVRFRHWSSAEVAALQDYLKARAAHEIASGETTSLPKT